MSVHAEVRRISVPQLTAYKGSKKIAALTAYTAPIARLLDQHLDMILVGDSTAMVGYGMPDTLSITTEMLTAHARAVVNATRQVCVVVDMPFGSYEESPEQAFRNAARIMAETGAGAVKLEGGRHMAATIRFLVERGIPVMGHVGLTPQSVNTLGGYRVQGKGRDAGRILDDARAVAEARAFAVVLEKVPAALADRITREVDIPTVGIGASAGCDGQILMIDDMLGLFDAFKPKFVKRYAHLATDAAAAIRLYADEVRSRSFPAPEHIFTDEGSPKP